MPHFQPFLGTFLRVGSNYFEFLPHPFLPNDKQAVFVLEGGASLVYRIRHLDTQKLYALKVFKPAYHDSHIAWGASYLDQHPNLPGLQLKERVCLSKANYPDLIHTFPELEYAILMPWVEAQSWVGFLLDPQASAQYKSHEALNLALATANILWNLESHGLAHADIAGGNVLLIEGRQQVQLLDLEDMFIPGMPVPRQKSRGSPGYQHRRLGPNGQWCPEGDRFAGAILLTEMLTWWEPRVRARVADYAETLFLPEDLQILGSACWQEVRNVLYSLSPALLSLFDQAWASSSLAECPPLSTWAMTLLSDFA